MKRSTSLAATLTITLVLLVCGVFYHSQFSSVIWHLTHGRDVVWDSHTVTLPIWWRPSTDTNIATLKLTRATAFGADVELNVTHKGPSFLLESSDAGLQWQKDSLPKMNSDKSSGAFKAYTVVTSGGEVFCIGSGTNDVAVSFVCRVVGTDWDIRFLGDDADASDARAIVGSLR
jgi:hypothetical protein